MTVSSGHLLATWILWLSFFYFFCHWLKLSKLKININVKQISYSSHHEARQRWSVWVGFVKPYFLHGPGCVFFLCCWYQAWWLWGSSSVTWTGSKVYNKPGKHDLERKHSPLDSFSVQCGIVIQNLKSWSIRLKIRNCFLLSKFTSKMLVGGCQCCKEEKVASGNFQNEIQCGLQHAGVIQ